MRLTLIKKRDPSERDSLVVMILAPSGERKVTFSVNIGQTLNLQELVDENELDCTADELGYAIMGDKRFKGLFKIENSTAAPKAKGKAKDDGDDIKPNAKKAGTVTRNKAMSADTYKNKNLGAG